MEAGGGAKVYCRLYDDGVGDRGEKLQSTGVVVGMEIVDIECPGCIEGAEVAAIVVAAGDAQDQHTY